MAAKTQQTLKCNLDPEGFKQDILDDEANIDHAEHVDTPYGKWSHLLKPLEADQLDAAMKY